MDNDPPIEVRLQAPRSECLALAQMVKRLTWSDVVGLSPDKDEARTMLYGVEALRKGLADAGFAPR
jgi:hypothetical protein